MKVYAVVTMQLPFNTANMHTSELNIVELFQQISSSYEMDLVGPIVQTSAKEWQFVVHNIGHCYDIIRSILTPLQLHGIDCFTGIGIGTISTKEASDSRTMDGEAFIHARNSLNTVLDSYYKNTKVIASKDCKIYVTGNKKAMNSITLICDDSNVLDLDCLINGLIQNNEYIYYKMTKKQLESIALYQESKTYQGMMNHDTSLSKGKISNRLQASNYWLMSQNTKKIKELFCLYQDN